MTEAAGTSYDLAIIGSGPAGLSAAIYATREDMKTVVLDKAIVGGLVAVTDMIDNYPGFPDGVSGLALAESLEKQARRFGADIQTGIEVQKIESDGKLVKLTAGDKVISAKAVLIATGTGYRKLGIPGEQEFMSKGVHYCATCDGPLYKGKELIVVGGGNSAMQETVFLSKLASKITMLVRGPALKGSEVLIDEVKTLPNVNIQFQVTTTAIKGQDGRVVGIEGVNTAGKTVEFDAPGIFVFIGLIPNSAWLKGSVELDEYGFVKTDARFETSMKGVYAAGDVRSGATLQIASAVGEAVTAALKIREHLKTVG